jgi:polyhydroxyalkanoate synthesis regulator phasin
MLANLLEQGKAGREHVEQMVNSAVEKIIAKAELAKCSEVEALKERIARLEDQLRHSSQS